MPVDEAVDVVLAVADGLDTVHRSGRLHQDLTPATITVSDAGTVAFSENWTTASGPEALGDPAVAVGPDPSGYVAPESLRAARGTNRRVKVDDRRSNLYSLGAILYALVSGEPPFVAPAGLALNRKILSDPPAPVGHDGLDRFLATVLAKNPDHRYPSALHFREALEIAAGRAQAHAADPPIVPRPPWPPLAKLGVALAGMAAVTAVAWLVWPHPPRYEGHTRAVGALIQLENGLVASGSWDATVQIWDPADPDTTIATYRGHSEAVIEVVELSSGLIASSSNDHTVQIWDPADPDTTITAYSGHNFWVVEVAELENGLMASVGYHDGLHIWDPADPGTTIASIPGEDISLAEVVTLANGLVAYAGDGPIQVFDPADPGVIVATYGTEGSFTWAVVETEDGMVVSAAWDGARIWDPADLEAPVGTYYNHGPLPLSLVELQGGLIASVGQAGDVQVWDPADPDVTISAFVIEGDEVEVTELLALDNGLVAAGATDRSVHLWDPDDLERLDWNPWEDSWPPGD